MFFGGCLVCLKWQHLFDLKQKHFSIQNLFAVKHFFGVHKNMYIERGFCVEWRSEYWTSEERTSLSLCILLEWLSSIKPPSDYWTIIWIPVLNKCSGWASSSIYKSSSTVTIHQEQLALNGFPVSNHQLVNEPSLEYQTKI